MRITRMATLMVSPVAALSAGLLLCVALAALSLAQPIDSTPQTNATPTPYPVFSATLGLAPDRQFMLLGETLVVTLTLTVSDGCQYPVYEAKLTQTGHDAPHFRYVDPPTSTIGPPVTMPLTYTLEAIAAGYVTLDGQLYGEKNCGDGWQWTYVNGTSPSIKVTAWPYQLRLPMVVASQ